MSHYHLHRTFISSRVQLADGRRHAAPYPHSPKVTLVEASKGGFGLSTTKIKTCPCGTGEPYASCCQRFHDNQIIKASTPVQQLRARFSAYATKEYRYIVRTTHRDNPARSGSSDGKVSTSFEQDVKVTCSWADFSGLVINGDARPVQLPEFQDEAAEVEFEYKMKQLFELANGNKIPPTKQEVKTIKETAIFCIDDGEWKLLSSRNNWDRERLQLK